MKIKDVEIGNLFLAPMAGVTDVGFRTICKMAGADLTFTEMVNATALLYDSEKTKELLITSDMECPKAVQIFGHNEQHMAKVCQSEYLNKFDIIDINFGCPAPKIVKNGDGSALLKDLRQIEKIVSACVKATNKPITCKFRKGFEEGSNVAVQVAKICEEAGAKMLTIHGRTREQMYSGNVDLETIAKVKQSVSIPVIGNGDVFDQNSYNNMLKTGVDGVMVARGALGNPNIFATLKKQTPLNEMHCIKEHINILRQHFSEHYLTTYMRKHLLWYVAGKENANKLKIELATSNDLNQSLNKIEEFLKNTYKL